MKIRIVSLIVLGFLIGCKHESIITPTVPADGSGGNALNPGLVGGYLPDIGVPDPIISLSMTLDGNLKFDSSLLCNDQDASHFQISQKDNVFCTINGRSIATFTAPFDANKNGRNTDSEVLSLISADEYRDSPVRQENLQILMKNMATIHGDKISLVFRSTLDALTFENYLRHNLDLPKDQFLEAITEKIANDNQVDKQPSTHVPNISPSFTPGTSSNLNSPFVSANAEESLSYIPTDVIPSLGRLLDSQGRVINGVSYFSNNTRGITGVDKTGAILNDGSFEFSWGDIISFSIDTFELGSTRANKTDFYISELGKDNEGKNAEALIHRYASIDDSKLIIPDKVTQIFSLYPNVINEVISLSLPNGDIELDIGDGKTQIVPGEFFKQFDSGLAALIDQSISPISRFKFEDSLPKKKSAIDSESSQIQDIINKLWGATDTVQANGWKKVDRFHIFHDSTNFYGSTGSARAQAAVNIANSAFPVLMARNDNNYWIDFGKPKAWDSNSLAFITEAPSTVVPDKVSEDTSTFNLPFISLGEIGKGKLMVLGNARYNSVLVCPNGFSWGGTVKNGTCSLSSDRDDMANFFSNVIRYLTGSTSNDVIVGTNIPEVYFKSSGQTMGSKANFELDSRFSKQTQQLTSFHDLNVNTIPLIIINAYDYKGKNINSPYDIPLSADVGSPKLSRSDVTDLIDYINNGGSVLMMETIINTNNSEISRLLDSAGIAFGIGNSVVADGNGPSGGHPDRPRSQREHGIWVIERYAAVEDESSGQQTLPYVINSDGSIEWKYIVENRPDDKPKLEVASWVESEAGDKLITHYAFIDESQHWKKDISGKIIYNVAGKPEVDNASLSLAKNKVLDAFKNSSGQRAYSECKNSEFHYEINCLEYRPGNSIPITGGLYVPRYTDIKLGESEANAMVKAANLGTNIHALYQHERYFRTKGKSGARLNSVDLNRIYQNMSVWLWNDLDYRYDDKQSDELGFKVFTQYLNCYTSNNAGGNTTCPEELKDELTQLGMIYDEKSGSYAGQMDPSYPLNYMEKPLTRLMLGRSFWDLDIKVDVRKYPGEVTTRSGGGDITLDMRNNTAAWFAGNRQPTGQWAEAHQPFSVSVSGETSPVTITIALADDLTGREKHELGLKRPPRMSKSFVIGGDSPKMQTFTVPYGGLIYAQGGNSQQVKLTFSGTIDAPLYIDGKWRNPLLSGAPIGEVVSDTFIFTAPKANLNADGYLGGIEQFAKDLDQFSADLNDFYARDEGADGDKNRKATDKSMPNNRHHFVNDVAISVGAAHSGYPVMNDSFITSSRSLNTMPLNSWLLWHEVGHNSAEAPFNVDGATEVVNNLLALYMQDRHQGKMSRVEQDIRYAFDFVNAEHGHAWGAGGAGERLVMFAQLKEWAETEFDINDWYNDKLPGFYIEESGIKGWNLFKLMHRLMRNENDDQINMKGENQCKISGIGKSDLLMLCASYAAQTDLSEFFKAWNPGSKAFLYPDDPQPYYEGGITPSGIQRVKSLKLNLPQKNPLSINSVTQH